ncbi:aldo/keto reductase family protein [Hirsutella rhossiliensis]|uniref:Aldo/keto reductase family domain-containing protein n=1 Tax=Hirsutella rhossiliensis TaxID=111463 RepID=A0A9P8MUF9_9HYPO|nr:aldo/keto reductase family domain-containing protein [Hirsutella rhossiliensis]KAH0961450.1 aldo/keto reductase family domain-containing protein [Hirsutella rhossiliensis]
MASREPLSHVLPPLVLGTATFNTQYHHDPTHMPYADIVRRALEHDIAAFDTSPYYGPSETLLGDALAALDPRPPRASYFLITKAGRIAADEFDYSPAWMRYSVCRSLERLGTPYLDLVYAHDVEFVAPADVLAAVAELRRLRDAGRVRYVGISGYPVAVLAGLAELVLETTGEPLDAVMSYGHFCVQNGQLGRPDLLARFRAAGVECVLNASMLGMGLLTSRGVDNGPMASWHPAPPALRKACADLAAIAARHGERLEEVAIRWALENWARVGAPLGTLAYPSRAVALPARIGVSVMGVAAVEELEETWALWKSVVGGGTAEPAAEERRAKIAAIVAGSMWPSLGPWKDFAWESPGEAFANRREAPGAVPDDNVAERWGLIAKTMLDSAKI